MSLIENAPALLSSLLLSAGYTLHDPCNEVAIAIKAAGQNVDTTLVQQYTNAACDKNQPLELRDILISSLYAKATDEPSAEQARQWASFAVDANQSYLTYLALYDASQNAHVSDAAEYANSPEFNALMDTAASYGVKGAISEKLLRLSYQGSYDPNSNMAERLPWTVVGLFDFSGGDAYLKNINSTISEVVREMKKGEDRAATGFRTSWSKYETDDQYDQYMKPAMDKAPSLVKYSMDLAPFKKVAETAQADYENNTAILAKQKAEDDARLAIENSDIAENPYVLYLTCEAKNQAVQMPVNACMEELSVSYTGGTDSYGMVDFLRMQTYKFSKNIPEHFTVLVESGKHGDKFSANLVIKDRRTGQESYRGNTSVAYDLLKVSN